MHILRNLPAQSNVKHSFQRFFSPYFLIPEKILTIQKSDLSDSNLMAVPWTFKMRKVSCMLANSSSE